MEDIRIEINMQFCQMDELSAEDQELVRAAIGATANSYARYSNFNVGAALRLADGSITTGANQENAAFPSGLCAERCAIFAAQSHHPEHAITALAIAAKNVNGLMPDPVSPCGACRQGHPRDGRPLPTARAHPALRHTRRLLHQQRERPHATLVCRREHALAL